MNVTSAVTEQLEQCHRQGHTNDDGGVATLVDLPVIHRVEALIAVHLHTDLGFGV